MTDQSGSSERTSPAKNLRLRASFGFWPQRFQLRALSQRLADAKLCKRLRSDRPRLLLLI